MDGLLSLVKNSELITASSNLEKFKELTTFWAAQINIGAKAVGSSLDFAFRGYGHASLPAKDVIVSLGNLSDFSYDADNKTITVGAGLRWSAVVGGTIVTGGFSWLSGEYGCISDPDNMLDCEVIKHDGSVIMASSEPDLLWALRGGGTGFAVITKAIFRLHPISRDIYCGTIVTPSTCLTEAAARMTHYFDTYKEPGTSVFMFLERKFNEMFENAHDGDNLVFQVFDRNGEAHGREAFAWALTLPGAQDFTRSDTMLDVAKIQGLNPQPPRRCDLRRLLICDSDCVRHMSGTTYQFWAPSIVPEFTPTSIKNCIEWYNGLEKAGKSIAECTYMGVEEAQRDGVARSKGCQNMLIIGVGCGTDVREEEVEAAKQVAREAPTRLMGNDPRLSLAPNAYEEWFDWGQVYREKYPKLQRVLSHYDPKRRFKSYIPHLS
ncbi:FAD binding domain-containing protein [Colletotrichum sojae]|uniref:FAD binding domain-containing protein n=1 Tax=Colletotrichum sojae TaxID=2175907 RepID=A0A8H6MQM7_9PEZI|nr:FAD binding domain-containing protein [Colletotrichum sojae]